MNFSMKKHLWTVVAFCWACSDPPVEAECGGGRSCPEGQACILKKCWQLLDAEVFGDLRRSPQPDQRLPELDLGLPDSSHPDLPLQDLLLQDLPLDQTLLQDEAVLPQDEITLDQGPPQDSQADLSPVAECEPGEVQRCEGLAVGSCRSGHRRCSEVGLWQPCEEAIGPQPERCNELDDDCDGEVDNLPGLGEPCDGVGSCGEGIFECGLGEALRCSTDIGGSQEEPVGERCNTLDDDCDGEIDEGFPLNDPCEGYCGVGVLECLPGGLNPICSTDEEGSQGSPQEEICNGLDDDCDGEIDEDFPVGISCEGLGACFPGVQECGLEGLRCSVDPGGSDSLPGLIIGAACPAQGICGVGEMECQGGLALCSSRPGGSAQEGEAERCNGLDDDCDGESDEEFELEQPCEGLGICGVGIWECDGEEGRRCSSHPGGSQDQSQLEICDDRDNDCDGAIDEGSACGGEVCETAPLLEVGEVETGNSAELNNDYAHSLCTGRNNGPDQLFRFTVPQAGDYLIGVAPLSREQEFLFWVNDNLECAELEQCLENKGATAEELGDPLAEHFSLSPEQLYHLIVDVWDEGGGGPFVAGFQPFEAGERCGNAIPLRLPARFVGSTEGRDNDLQACGDEGLFGPDQIFHLEGEGSWLIRARASGGAALSLSVLGDCLQPQECIAQLQGDPGEAIELRVDLEGAAFLVVDHPGSRSAAFLLEIEH